MKELPDVYAQWTDSVAQYPVEVEGAYLALGLVDELGEFLSAIADNSDVDDIVAEAGDILWYAARYATRVLGVPFRVVIEDACGLPTYFDDAAVLAASQIAGVEKKRLRDGSSWDSAKITDKNEVAIRALERILSFVESELHDVSSTVREAMLLNMNKLNNRLESGTIKGDGDHR